MRTILPVLFILCGCGYNYPDVHPTIPDFQLNEARVYKIVDKQNVKFEYDKTIPLQSVDGYVCLSQADYIALREFYISQKKSQK